MFLELKVSVDKRGWNKSDCGVFQIHLTWEILWFCGGTWRIETGQNANKVVELWLCKLRTLQVAFDLGLWNAKLKSNTLEPMPIDAVIGMDGSHQTPRTVNASTSKEKKWGHLLCLDIIFSNLQTGAQRYYSKKNTDFILTSAAVGLALRCWSPGSRTGWDQKYRPCGGCVEPQGEPHSAQRFSIFSAHRAGLINEALPLAHSRGAIQT